MFFVLFFSFLWEFWDELRSALQSSNERALVCMAHVLVNLN
jgi:hypothetical protein